MARGWLAGEMGTSMCGTPPMATAQRLAGHHGAVMSVAWSPDGRRLASGGDSQSGELFVWDAHSGERMPP